MTRLPLFRPACRAILGAARNVAGDPIRRQDASVSSALALSGGRERSSRTRQLAARAGDTVATRPPATEPSFRCRHAVEPQSQLLLERRRDHGLEIPTGHYLFLGSRLRHFVQMDNW